MFNVAVCNNTVPRSEPALFTGLASEVRKWLEVYPNSTEELIIWIESGGHYVDVATFLTYFGRT